MSSSSSEQKPIDLTHHISHFARRYANSPLKSIHNHFGKDLIPLAGGWPCPDYFPFTSISADALPVDAFPLIVPPPTSAPSSSPFSWLWRLFGASKDDSTHVEIPHKQRPGDGGLNLATALQYGPATGLERTRTFIHEFTERIYSPAYDDWTTIVDTGNTDGWNRISRLLLNPGDTVLVEEWTFPSALMSARPIDMRWKGVPTDSQGMRPDALKAILAGWDVDKDGPRPRVIYTIPVGQNPSGVTMGFERKKAIYDICVEEDLIIAEDDPYYILQLGEYVPKSQRKVECEPVKGEDVAHFVASLVPSYLRIDTQGRVLRMDTFSKTIAPGTRLGWVTCHPLFAERLERMGEVSTQSPCGLGQTLVIGLIAQWTFEGYVRWLRGLRAQYRHRRDHFIDCLAEEFDLFPTLAEVVPAAWAASDDHAARRVLSAYPRGGGSGGASKEETSTGRRLLSFVPPSAGMFVWVKLYFGDVPDKTDEKDGSVITPERQFWERLGEAGVAAAPGWIFEPTAEAKTLPLQGHGADSKVGHMRMSYAMADMETTRRGVKIFAQTLKEFSRV